PQIQFGLKTILAITTGFALLFAAGYWFGEAGYVGFLVIAAFCLAIFSPRIQLVERLMICCAIVVVLALFLPAIEQPRGDGRKSQCNNNLKQVGLGLQNYNDIYKCFPPVYTTDENGKPMHSWRVLILPF